MKTLSQVLDLIERGCYVEPADLRAHAESMLSVCTQTKTAITRLRADIENMEPAHYTRSMRELNRTYTEELGMYKTLSSAQLRCELSDMLDDLPGLEALPTAPARVARVYTAQDFEA